MSKLRIKKEHGHLAEVGALEAGQLCQFVKPINNTTHEEGDVYMVIELSSDYRPVNHKFDNKIVVVNLHKHRLSVINPTREVTHVDGTMYISEETK